MNRNRYEKPPLGVMPKRIWKLQRLNSLKRAIGDYANAGFKIPEEWIQEFNELLKELEVEQDDNALSADAKS